MIVVDVADHDELDPQGLSAGEACRELVEAWPQGISVDAARPAVDEQKTRCGRRPKREERPGWFRPLPCSRHPAPAPGPSPPVPPDRVWAYRHPWGRGSRSRTRRRCGAYID